MSNTSIQQRRSVPQDYSGPQPHAEHRKVLVGSRYADHGVQEHIPMINIKFSTETFKFPISSTPLDITREEKNG